MIKICEKCGRFLNKNKKHECPNKSPRRIDLDLKEIKKFYINEKKTAKEIAKIMHVATTTIFNRLKDLKIERRRNKKRAKNLDLKKIKDLYINQKKTIDEMTLILGVSNKTIIKRLKEGGIKMRRRGELAKINLNLDKIKDLYINKRKSAREIGKILDVSRATIYNKLREMEIERRHVSEAQKGHHYTLRAEFKKGHKPRITEETIRKRTETRKKNNKEWHTEKTKEKIGKKAKKRWKNLKYREKMLSKEYIEKRIKGLMKRPTSFEQKIILLCSKHRLPFIYTGDGRILIGYKNPDFVYEENKVIIEVFLNYFKIRDYGSVENYMKVRGEYFAKYGYKTIFINEQEVTAKNWEEICLNKIQNFLK